MLTKAQDASPIDYMQLVKDYHRSMKDCKLNLVYQGEINQSITKTFTAIAEKNLLDDRKEKATVRKVYHVMVECLQNIYKHSDKKSEGPGKSSHGIFLIGEDEGGIIVSTGNQIERDKVEEITGLLNKINSMNPEEIKQLYKTQMREGVLSEKGGAGLGFIDICRKTGSKLEFNFETINEKISFFILKTYIAK